MRYRIEFRLEGLPPTINSIGRKHWTVKAKAAKFWKTQVIIAIGSNKPTSPLKKAKLILTRASSASCDPDGLTSSFKHLIDGLVSCGILENDKFENIGFPDYRYEKTQKGAGFVCIEVIEID